MKQLLYAALAGGLFLLSGPLFAAPPAEATDAFIDGELLIVHIDYKNRNSEFAYHVKEKTTGEIIELKFDRNPPRNLRTGDKLTVHGKLHNRQIWVQDVSGSQSVAEEPAAAETVAAAVQRKFIYMVVNLANSSSPAYFSSTDVSAAANRMFYDTYSVDSVYQEGSFGNIAFPPPENGGGKAVGPLTIEAPATCDYYTIASRADAAAAAAGELLSQYQRKIYLIPPSPVSPCNWLALGQIGSYGSSSTRLSWTTSNDANAIIHELGHNEGWHHAGKDADNNEALDAGTSGEYGDTSDAMGYCCSKRKFNAVHLDQIGWLPADKTVTVISSGIYHLEPVGNYSSTCTMPAPDSGPCPQLVKIQKDAGSYQYNLSYRQVKGLDQSLGSVFTNGVNIHNGKKLDNWSYHIQSLTDGATFNDAVNGISITQLGHDAEKVVVQIDLEPDSPPADPSGLNASTVSSSAINLSWSDNATDEAGFKIERSLNQTDWSQIGQVSSNVTSYQNTGLASGTTYYYRVLAYNNSSMSGYSNIASAATQAALPPNAPSNLVATAQPKKKIKLTWTDNSVNETSFSLERSTNNTTWSAVATLAANTTAYTNNGLTAGTTYYYRIRAANSNGSSAYSNSASAKAIR